MANELGNVEKLMVAELLVCGRISYGEYSRVTDIPQHGTGVRNNALGTLEDLGVLDHLLYPQV